MIKETLYNVYRPSQLRGIYGQDTVVKQLKRLFYTRDFRHHAYLFFGPYGCGKTTFAKILARAFNCSKSPQGDICSLEEPCISCSAPEYHFNILEYNASIYGRVEEVRDIIRSIKNKPFGSYKYKVYFFDEAHIISKASWTAMLLDLENPPEYVKFIFATTDIDLIPNVVKSRLFIYRISGIDNSSIKNYLRYIIQCENYQCDDSVVENIAIKARGSMRDAISILSQLISYCHNKSITQNALNELLGIEKIEKLKEFVLAIKNKDINIVLSFLKIYREKYKAENLINSCIEYLNQELHKTPSQEDRIVLKTFYHISEFINNFSNYGDTFNLFDIALVNNLIEARVKDKILNNPKDNKINIEISHIQKNINVVGDNDDLAIDQDKNRNSDKHSYKKENLKVNKNSSNKEENGHFLKESHNINITLFKDDKEPKYLDTKQCHSIYTTYARLIPHFIKSCIKNKYENLYEKKNLNTLKIKREARVFTHYKYFRLKDSGEIEFYQIESPRGPDKKEVLEQMASQFDEYFNDSKNFKEYNQSDYDKQVIEDLQSQNRVKIAAIYYSKLLSKEEYEKLKSEDLIYELPINNDDLI